MLPQAKCTRNRIRNVAVFESGENLAKQTCLLFRKVHWHRRSYRYRFLAIARFWHGAWMCCCAVRLVQFSAASDGEIEEGTA